jgi:DNA mismatch repair protein MutL
MGKIRVLSDNLANQIAAGEVVERPASVAKELLENSLDAGATRIVIEIEAGGRRLLKITDNGEGMNRDDAILAFERHATSKLRTMEDLSHIQTLGFRGEALASIASVARVELVTKTASEAAGTRVKIEGGKLLDVIDAPHPVGTTVAIRDLFFNVPARRKFLRSEATENFHLINLVTHYALAHPDKDFTLNNNGRESLRFTPARSLRERAYQIFGGDFLESLLPVSGGQEFIAKISGFVSAPRERRTTRDAQYFFINGRFVRDKVMARALTEGYRSVLPHGVYPVALLFAEVPLEEVDVNVHPAKTEVRFRRPEAVREVLAEAVRHALAAQGFVTITETTAEELTSKNQEITVEQVISGIQLPPIETQRPKTEDQSPIPEIIEAEGLPVENALTQAEIDFIVSVTDADTPSFEALAEQIAPAPKIEQTPVSPVVREFDNNVQTIENWATKNQSETVLPPLDSAAKLVKTQEVEQIASGKISPLGQLHESYIIAVDKEGLLLVDQHVAHERILFDKYRQKVGARRIESQNLLLPETFDLTPAQATAYDLVEKELEESGFGLMRLSGRTVAIKAVPADLPAHEAKNLLREILDTVDAEKRGAARDTWRDEIAASLACKAAVKVNMKLTPEKMQWLIDNLLKTASPTTCPHGRPVILRLTMRDIERGFHRT